MTNKYKPEKTIEIAKHFSWLSFLFILATGMALTVLIGNYTRSAFIKSQEDYVLLLSENLNKQLFRRFTLPVAVASSTVALSDENQFRLLSEIIESLLSGLKIEGIRILDSDNTVVFSLDNTEIRSSDFSSEEANKVFTQEIPYSFNIESNISYYEAIMKSNLVENSYLLGIYYPLSIDFEIASWYEGDPILGVMQISVDISNHYEIVLKTQKIIFVIFVLSSIILFALLQYIARRAEFLIADRMEKNKQLESQLHQQEKLVSMGRMVASIAHEIRNPLGIIRSSTDFLLGRTKNKIEDSSYKILEAMHDEVVRLGATVGDFLDYARPRQPKNLPVLLNKCINNVLLFFNHKFEEQNIICEEKIEEKLIVYGEEELLYRAFYNLIANAVQAIESSEKIKEISIKAEKRIDKAIVVEICDSGLGFSEKALQNALDPFYTTKETGTGLGLPIVHSIIESHGGFLKIKNKEKGGACITVIFPYKDLTE